MTLCGVVYVSISKELPKPHFIISKVHLRAHLVGDYLVLHYLGIVDGRESRVADPDLGILVGSGSRYFGRIRILFL